MPGQQPANSSIPRWLRFVLNSDRAGSAWFIGTGSSSLLRSRCCRRGRHSPGLWVVIAVAGLWLGVLGIAMATGLAMVLRSGGEIPEDYWRSIVDYPRVSTHATAD